MQEEDYRELIRAGDECVVLEYYRNKNGGLFQYRNGRLIPSYSHTATFFCWSSDYEESDTGFGTFATALVRRWSDGVVENIPVNRLCFV